MFSAITFYHNSALFCLLFQGDQNNIYCFLPDSKVCKFNLFDYYIII